MVIVLLRIAKVLKRERDLSDQWIGGFFFARPLRQAASARFAIKRRLHWKPSELDQGRLSG
jgi:hypothetical protein